VARAGERVVSDGRLLMSTPVDPTFLILPYLIRKLLAASSLLRTLFLLHFYKPPLLKTNFATEKLSVFQIKILGPHC
jgi:hypothetical protein